MESCHRPNPLSHLWVWWSCYLTTPSIIHLSEHFTYPNEFLVLVGHRGSDKRGSTVLAYTLYVHIVERCGRCRRISLAPMRANMDPQFFRSPPSMDAGDLVNHSVVVVDTTHTKCLLLFVALYGACLFVALCEHVYNFCNLILIALYISSIIQKAFSAKNII